jgi:hypothetical protein
MTRPWLTEAVPAARGDQPGEPSPTLRLQRTGAAATAGVGSGLGGPEMEGLGSGGWRPSGSPERR